MWLTRRWTHNAGLLLLLASVLVIAAVLIGFGGGHQGGHSSMIIGIPNLWFLSLILLPVFFFFLLGFVWKRLDRITR